MSDVSIKLHEALKKYGSFPTLPVGIKMVNTDAQAPEKARYPVPNLAVLSEPKFPKEYYALDPTWESYNI